jgi:hypothetical protein
MTVPPLHSIKPKASHTVKPRPINKISIACKKTRETNCLLRLLSASQILPPSRLADLTD